jgi:hypothetical protein
VDPGGRRGGSLKVLAYVQDHPAELAYDFRTKFQLSIEAIGDTVSLREAALLIAMLLIDTNSWLQAVVNDWKHPVNREWIVLTHVYDLLAAVNSKSKPKPYPTPWLEENTQKIGGKKRQSNSEVLLRLAQMNPKDKNGK